MMNMDISVTPNYSYIFDFENDFIHQRTRKWMVENWTWVFYYCGIYMLVIFGGQHFMQNRPSVVCIIAFGQSRKMQADFKMKIFVHHIKRLVRFESFKLLLKRKASVFYFNFANLRISQITDSQSNSGVDSEYHVKIKIMFITASDYVHTCAYILEYSSPNEQLHRYNR
uniref:Very-long-chain 3-oxoacyl-CoA synthase n=1 Tax=Glossina brevipalpis TaxID=37001 RepID=A0A1A9WLM3_9MUSC